MFPYTVKYTDSEYDIQNNNLLYKIHRQCQNTFIFVWKIWRTNHRKCQFLICILYNFHNSYFANLFFSFFVILRCFRYFIQCSSDLFICVIRQMSFNVQKHFFKTSCLRRSSFGESLVGSLSESLREAFTNACTSTCQQCGKAFNK